MKILVVNGVNMNFLGIRNTDVYGKLTLKELEGMIEKRAKQLNFEVECYQSNIEGEIVNKLQEAYLGGIDAIVINPAAFTHTSVAIRDALEVFECPKVEVHMSNISARDEFRHFSYTQAVCDAQIVGMGAYGYICAVEYINQRLIKQ